VGPCTSPNHINLYGVVTPMAPNPLKCIGFQWAFISQTPVMWVAPHHLAIPWSSPRKSAICPDSPFWQRKAVPKKDGGGGLDFPPSFVMESRGLASRKGGRHSSQASCFTTKAKQNRKTTCLETPEDCTLTRVSVPADCASAAST
jgi:hypothetical protein